ncbi:hypothetical protein FNV43_RR03626 [Rhamnella rubrinervis]|uniref:Uncharacterized protein n=1 Tax=Rhamnella rubrinervis TaxID=2594499 RepID=A0A8K0MPG9_9ROSA|nr:hypothetical protein FNV43_RR03626 [Rhamnella rubrinervis]
MRLSYQSKRKKPSLPAFRRDTSLIRLLDNRASRRRRSFQTVYRINFRRHSRPPPQNKDKDKAFEAPKRNLGLEDSASVRAEPDQVTKIVDSLMTRHDRVILRGMSLKDIGHEAEQCALKLAQDCWYFTEMIIKMDNVFKKKTTALNNLTAMNKSLGEEDEPEKNVEAEKTPSPTRDSFMEAMNPIKAEGTEPIANIGEVSSTAQPNR